MAILISEQDVLELLSPKEALECVKQAHIDLENAQAQNIVRNRARTKSMSLHTLSAASQSLNSACLKSYTATRNGTLFHILYYDAISGELKAIIQAGNLGKLRTTAASALAADTLLKPGNYSLGLFGTGFQAEGIVNAYTKSELGIEISEIKVSGRNQDKLKEFCKKLSSEKLKLIPCSSEELCKSSDLIVTATTSSKPVFSNDDLENVKHISAIGSNSLARQEIPARTVTAANLVVVDTIEVAKKEAGDLLSALENGKLFWNEVAELGELLTNKKETPKDGFSLFCSQGLAVQDLYCADLIYNKIKETGGKTIEV